MTFRHRHIRLPVDCPVCSRPSLYSYYSAKCCESCKQFFRRVVIKQLELACPRDGDCEVHKGKRCNSCRLERCIQAGMDPLLVNLTKQGANVGPFLAKLMDKKRACAQRQLAGGEASLNMQISGDPRAGLLESLLFLEAKQRTVWTTSTDLPWSYLNGFKTLEELLRYPGNILTKTENMQGISPPNWDKQDYVTQSEKLGISVGQNIKVIAVDRLLLVEMAKALPFFRRLDIKDQIVQLRHISMKVGILLNTFYAAIIGADTWTRANGMMFITFYGMGRFKSDPKIAHMSWKKLCYTVDCVKRLGMGREEFILLLAILYCSSTSDSLSKVAKNQLYTESVHYGRALLNHLQQKHGIGPGAQKYAEYMHLLEIVVQTEQLVQMLVTYIGCFFKFSTPFPNFLLIPKALWSIF